MGSLRWHRLATVSISTANALSTAAGIVGFANGYVVLDGEAGRVWHSKDGIGWRRITLPGGGDPDANGLRGRVVATDGRDVLVVGGYSHEPCGLSGPGDTAGGGPDCTISPVAWVSGDGISWRRAAPPDTDGEFVAAWPVAGGGWEAALSGWHGECLGGDTLWRSADGIAWKPATPKPPAPWEGYEHAPLGVASGSGSYLLAAAERDGERTTLAMMAGAGAWQTLDGFPGGGVEVAAGVAPAAGRSRWALGGVSGCGDPDLGCTGGPTIWSSMDGAAWTTTALRVGPGVAGADPPVTVTAVSGLTLSDLGYVAVGADASWSEGARHETWVSDDGVTWAELPGGERTKFDYGPGLVAAGPAGVIGISGSKTDGLSTVWQLR